MGAVVCAAVLLSGCVDNTADEMPKVPKVPVEPVAELSELLPAQIRERGYLVAGVNVPYQPNEYKDPDGNIVGFDVDLLDAVATTLGVRVEYAESSFEKIIPAVQAGTYDVGVSSITDTVERENEVDFTTYFSAGIQWAQQAGEPVDPENACGLRVAVQTTTISHIEDVPGKSAACEAAGEPPIDMKAFDEQSAATNALVLGQVDAMSADSPVTAFAIERTEGRIESAGPVFESAPYGWAVADDSPVAVALQRALQHLIDTGPYAEITENWGLQDGAISTSVINGAVQ